MFIIDDENNETISMEKSSFKSMGYKERQNVQEWICKNTDILEEKLLIIQKEFAGFDKTNERLDLLALDEHGNIVVIENKLDDSGRDVVWQSLKYVSYCASLTKDEIVELYKQYLNSSREEAEQEICNFFDEDDIENVEINKGDQRIIMVSASFRNEVTSTVMWLLEHGVKIKCIKLTPYKYDDKSILNSEQIIPVKDIEDYMVKVSNKKQVEANEAVGEQNRHKVRRKFWDYFLEKINKKADLFSNISTSKESWITKGSGYSGIAYDLNANGKYCSLGIFINNGTQEINSAILKKLINFKSEIESEFGQTLEWIDKAKNKTCYIRLYNNNYNLYNEDDWDDMCEFLFNIIEFEKVMKKYLKKVME